MQPILKGGFIMVNTKEMTESLIKELAFSEEELRELKAAKEKPMYLMKIVRKRLQNGR